MLSTRLPDDDDALLARAGVTPPDDAAEGLFAADGWLRRVSAEPALLFGGGRALLLEIAHPLVAAGVAQHSNFEADPFGRLRRTLDAMSAISFADRASALAAARSVERAHARVQGTLAVDAGPFRAGTPYTGRDPELVRWVWATLVDTSLAVYEHFVAPLAAEAREEFYCDHAAIARVLGTPPELVPVDWDGFRRWFDGVVAGETLSVSDEARRIAEAVLRAPATDSGPVRLITAALLPPRLREAFGLPWSPERAERFEKLAASVRGLRRDGS